jgi:DNA invertase Pin-like site-specific DNA recombinase
VGKYVRQSTAYQVANNTESGRRQYSLVERARRLGWSDVQVIDDDLGRSGGGIVRPGFEKLLAAICERRVGAVLSIEASRLARVPVAAMDAAMAPPFVVVLPVKVAARQSAVGVERPVKVRKRRRRPDDID